MSIWMRIVVTGILLGFVAGCSSSGTEELATFQEDPADQLFNEGLTYLNAGKTKKAKEKFAALDRQHPYSEYARRAMVLSAYAHYTSGEHDDAVQQAKRFVTLYPGHDDVAYAYYIIGQSYFKQIPDVTRDQKQTQRALGAMREVIRRFPDSEYAGDARLKITITLDQLAGKEMQIGRYYQERKEYIAAVNRYKYVVSNYQTTRHSEEALYRLTESYLSMGIVTEAQTAAAILGHNFPESEWYAQAYGLLGKGGVKPEVNKGSWISRVFKRS